jgi:hypothetical protein
LCDRRGGFPSQAVPHLSLEAQQDTATEFTKIKFFLFLRLLPGNEIKIARENCSAVCVADNLKLKIYVTFLV